MPWDPTDLSRELAQFSVTLAALNPTNYYQGRDFTGTATAENTETVAPGASGTTFSIVVKGLLGAGSLDTDGTFLALHTGAGLGFYLNNTTRKPYLRTTGPVAVSGSGLPAVSSSQVILIVVSVTAGVPTFYLKASPTATVVAYAADDATAIATFTPTRIGGLSSSSSRLHATDLDIAYFPGVALTADDVDTLSGAVLGCVDATTAVFNISLARIGSSKQIGSLESDTTLEAIQARLHCTQDIETVLRDGDWPFARRYAALTLVAGTSDVPVNDDWTYSYRLPEDCLKAKRVIDYGQQRAFSETPTPFALGSDAVGPLLYSNLLDADLPNEALVLEYTVRVACPCAMGDALFRSALAWKFAHSMAPALSKMANIVTLCWQSYQFDLQTAKTVAAKEEQRQDTDDGDPWPR